MINEESVLIGANEFQICNNISVRKLTLSNLNDTKMKDKKDEPEVM